MPIVVQTRPYQIQTSKGKCRIPPILFGKKSSDSLVLLGTYVSIHHVWHHLVKTQSPRKLLLLGVIVQLRQGSAYYYISPILQERQKVEGGARSKMRFSYLHCKLFKVHSKGDLITGISFGYSVTRWCTFYPYNFACCSLRTFQASKFGKALLLQRDFWFSEKLR